MTGIGTWNRLARGYSLKKGFGRGLLDSEKKVLMKIITGSGSRSILDIGCGPGRHVRFFKSMGFSAKGMDFSIKMLGYAKKMGNDDYVLADCMNIPFSDNSFDCVTCLGNTIGSLEDFDSAANEMVRISRKICIIDFRCEHGKHGILKREFDFSRFFVRVWNEDEIRKLMDDFCSGNGFEYELLKGQKLSRGYFFYCVIRK